MIATSRSALLRFTKRSRTVGTKPAAAAYHELSFGSPPKGALEFHHDDDMPTPRPPRLNQPYALVEMLCASVNPADIMTINGTYPSPYRPNSAQEKFARSKRAAALGGGHQTIAGSEGWGRVVEVVCNEGADWLAVGDYVTPSFSGFGTWRSSMWLPCDHLVPILRGGELLERFGPAAVAPFFQTAGTAWRMLHDFGDLNIGDVVVQNAGNSAVSLMASQLAYELGIKTVSLVRRKNRSTQQFDELVQYLMVVGKNAAVFAEEDVENGRESFEVLKTKVRDFGAAPQLALNSVGGTSSNLLLKLLGDGGTLLSYGGMSQLPIEIKTTHLIFRDIRLCGYWHSRWMAQRSTVESRSAMVNQLVDLVLDGRVQLAPVKCFALSEFEAALDFISKQSTEAIRRKAVFNCQQQ